MIPTTQTSLNHGDATLNALLFHFKYILGEFHLLIWQYVLNSHIVGLQKSWSFLDGEQDDETDLEFTGAALLPAFGVYSGSRDAVLRKPTSCELADLRFRSLASAMITW